MRATKAYIASLGTTGLLVASSIALLLVVSALVAFDGWPTAKVEDEAETVVVDAGEDASETAAEPTDVALDGSSNAAAAGEPAPATPAAGEGSPGGGGGGGDGAAPSPGASPAPPSTDPAPGSGPAPAPSPPEPLTPGSPEPPSRPPSDDDDSLDAGGLTLPGGSRLLPDDDGPGLTDGIGDATESATGALGKNAGGRSGPLGATLDDAGRAVGDVVRALDGD